MIAFHYPPALASGTHRALSFSSDLPEFGWEPILLTAHPRVYDKTDAKLLEDIPPDILVKRAFALNAARHLAIKGRYSRLTAWPDRWASWYLGAVPMGLYLILRYRPQILWTTYPIPTALQIGAVLHRLTGLPWIADLRDPLVSGQHPHDPALKETFQKIERKTILRSTRIVVSTPGLQRFLAARYPEMPQEKWSLLPNGFDEKSFRRFESLYKETKASQETLTLVHSGTLYTGMDERNPAPFLNTLVQLRAQGAISAPGEPLPDGIPLRIILRATGHDPMINAMITKRDLSDIVTTAPPLPYQQAIQEMYQVDGLLLFQGEGFNHLIPAKLFEYLRTFRPIFALTGEQGDSAHILKEAGLYTIAPLGDETAIMTAFMAFLQQIRSGQPQLPNKEVVSGYSRRLQAKRLATLFDEVTLQKS
ncbi:MAG: glycosyltransferase [Magnetococcales bacterium]|nr:glycosyltransferase [Magnetococcales bacterium]MBF0437610.1 glycosyltransferase [Magnetococcales bacterium]